ncbi:MAG: GNAT family N-acetyltransferase [Ectothiorhodospiraceae bacterium]|nr:GNAT family N-acetyltransferase [Ectothiorhodospiraceae bacterium]
MQWERNGFRVTDDRGLLDVDLIHTVLSGSYWARGIPREVVARSLEHSLCLGLYRGDTQVGFGRAVTDRATFAYVSDVFVLESYRGRGLGKWLVRCLMDHPELHGLRRWMLATKDAHTLYAQVGFTPLGAPHWFMEVHDPEAYAKDPTLSVER